MRTPGACSTIGPLLMLASVSCGGAPSGPSQISLVGAWGGDRVSMTATMTGSRLEFDCAHGEIPSGVIIDGAGAFTATGAYIREHGGPILAGETGDAHPAIYSGTVSGSTMRLLVRVTDTNDTLGTFTLMRDVPGRVLKCL